MQVAELTERYRLKPLAVTLVLFLIVGIVGSVFTSTSLSTMFLLMLGLFCYLILPGYSILLSVEMDDLERIVLSTAVGISLLPLIFFSLSLFWIRMRTHVVIVTIIVVVILGIALREREQIFSRLGRNLAKKQV
jgi:uncharacterized membrane protein